MLTSWGEIEVCDAHVHFFSSTFFRTLAAQKAALKPDTEPGTSADAIFASMAGVLEWQMPPADPGQLAEIWARELDRVNVSSAALIASAPGDEDSVARAVARFPGRFYGYFMLNATAPDAPDRVRGALNGGNLQGVCLFPAMHRFSMHDARVRAILEIVASRPSAVVFVHCGVLTVGVRAKLGLPSPFDMSFSNPLDLHAAALEFPGIKFIVPHFGAGYFREALMLCDLCPNVYLDTSSSNSWLRYQPEGVDLAAVFRRALEVAGPGRLLFGSDSSFFPRGWHAAIFQAQADVLAKLGLSAADARLIFGGNLRRLLAR
jgi:predicted TIM-barrel fold metal-dependent hydrolase